MSFFFLVIFVLLGRRRVSLAEAEVPLWRAREPGREMGLVRQPWKVIYHANSSGGPTECVVDSGYSARCPFSLSSVCSRVRQPGWR